MKRMQKAACIALTLALSIMGCSGLDEPLAGEPSAPKGFVWAIAPTLEFDALEPLGYDENTDQCSVLWPEGTGNYYAYSKNGVWGLLDTRTGKTLLEGAFSTPFSVCGGMHLAAQPAKTNPAWDEYDRVLVEAGSRLKMENGHGITRLQYLTLPNTLRVCQVNAAESGSRCRPVDRLEQPVAGLIGVAQGRWVEDEMGTYGESLVPVEPVRYAVADGTGRMLTEPVYEKAVLGAGGLIAVQQNSLWGYVNYEGRQVIPCEYESFWGCKLVWNAQGEEQYEQKLWPAPFSEGCVVVVKNGEYALLDEAGNILIAPGQLEAIAPRRDGLIWAKQQGRWGALQPENLLAGPYTAPQTEQKPSPGVLPPATGMTGQPVAGYNWAIAPCLALEKVEPVLSVRQLLPGRAESRWGLGDFYLAKGREGWSLLNTQNGNLLLQNAFQKQPILCDRGHLYELGSSRDAEQEALLNEQLLAEGSSLRMEVGHGGVSQQCLYEPENETLYITRSGDTLFEAQPLGTDDLPDQAPLPVRKGSWKENERDGGLYLAADPEGLYAVATPWSGLISDFIYEAAVLNQNGLVAVKQEGKWGYMNTQGQVVVPCEYEGFWGNSESGIGLLPAPATNGTVVVMQKGQYALLNTAGEMLIPFGVLEQMAPAYNDLLWVRQNGLWGALKLT